MLALLFTLGAVATASVTVVVDTKDAQLAAAIEARLSEDGIVVVESNTAADVTLSIASHETMTTIEVSRGELATVRRVDVSNDAPWVFQLELVQKATSAVRALLDRAPAEPPPGEPVAEQPAPPRIPTKAEPPPPVVRSRSPRGEPDAASAELAAAIDAQWRGTTIDPRVRVDGWTSVSGTWAFGGSATLAVPSRGELSIVEWRLLFGARYRIAGDVRSGLGFDVALLGGVEFHHFSRSPFDGVRPAGVATLPVRVRYRTDSFEVAVRSAVGAATQSRRHVVGGDTIWRRGAAHLELGVSVGWLFFRGS